MSPNSLNDYIVPGIAFLLLLAMGIFLIKGGGRGAWMIAGYNTMRTEKQEKYDKKALCRFVGWLCIAMDACMVPITVGEHFGIRWLAACGGTAVVVIALGALIYANTGGRFRKKD